MSWQNSTYGYDDQTNQIKTITLQTKLCIVIIKEVKSQHHASQQFFCMPE